LVLFGADEGSELQSQNSVAASSGSPYISEMKEFKATVKEVTPLVDADMGEAPGELKYVSVTFAIEALRRIWGRLSEPNSKSRKSSPVVMWGCNGARTRRLRLSRSQWSIYGFLVREPSAC
jgi:hypothetical protein